MEILGLDPCQSETQYLYLIFQICWSGNKLEMPFPLNFQFVSTLFPHAAAGWAEEEIYWKYVSTLRTAILNEACGYASGGAPEFIQAVLSNEASTASGTVISTNQSFG